jgi:CRISPR/Cas system-associated endonuclease Cas3-HD
MTQAELILEVGSEAIKDLSSEELAAILAKYTANQAPFAGLKVFDILSKKFQHSYRMGSTFEALSDKSRHYYELYLHYTQSVKAGKLGTHSLDEDSTEAASRNDIQRQKFPSDIRR